MARRRKNARKSSPKRRKARRRNPWVDPKTGRTLKLETAAKSKREASSILRRAKRTGKRRFVSKRADASGHRRVMTVESASVRLSGHRVNHRGGIKPMAKGAMSVTGILEGDSLAEMGAY